MRLLRAIRRRVDESLSLCSFSLFNEPTFYGTAGNRANVETTTAMERTRSAAQRPMDYWCGAGPTDFVVAMVGRESSERKGARHRQSQKHTAPGAKKIVGLRESQFPKPVYP
ncbi:uncharacterized protein LOC143208196 isoform X4 [Lasioglossum baleicum]|uniref:uncharacterized protein LOC143208196 isoform X4 n=1 Tax=Lasioglossum baleicum TaxID=434251 RepID=UPI003FCE904C